MNLDTSDEHQYPQLEQLDMWCEQALGSPSTEQREEAERRLRYYFPTFAETLVEISGSHGFSSGQERVLTVFPGIKGPSDSATMMMWLFNQSSKVLSMGYVIRRLRTLVLNHLGVLSNEQKRRLRNELFDAIHGKFTLMPGFLIDDATRTLALIVMFTWFDLDDSADVVEKMLELGKASEKHEILALQMMHAFVEEFNKELPAKYLAKQRRVVVMFRDKELKSIFEHSLKTMRSTIQAMGTSNSDGKRHILSNSLVLQRDCLSFDFIGLAPDDASDDAVAIQVPSSWKDLIQIDNFLDPYFDGYKHSSPPVSSLFLEVLVMLASIRRSFYMETVRVTFVKRMSAGIVEILQGTIGLEDVENYHHLCRLLARFRCIHTLVEIEETAVYRELLVSAAQFTSTALTLWEWSPNSFAPLLTFWAKIATTHDARDNEKSSIAGDVISESLPQIVKLYLDSMVQVTSRVVMGDSAADNPLEDTDGLVENITLLTNIVRSSYATCAPVIVNLFREMAGEYQSLLSSGQINEEGLMTIESQLTWPTYALALCINGRQPYKTMAEDDVIDAEMFSIGMELDRLVQRRLSSPIAVPPCEALELAFLQLYYSFRASYIGEQGYKTTSIFTKLSEIAGITDSAAVLEITMQKVMFNLKTWRTQTAVISRTLQLLHDMSIGYVSVRQITKLNTIKLLLANHSSEQFHFLSCMGEYKQRALYYSALARILMASDSSAAMFAEFVRPWSAMIDGMLSLPDMQFAQPSMRLSLIRILRDLRGFLTALSTRAGFTMFFNWICPSYIQLVHRCLLLSKDPPVHVAALKFMSEFVFNRTQRLNFDISSPNGILIFREASKAMWEYGSLILKSSDPVRDIYKDRYKGVSVCFNILTRLFMGKYVAIGVMPLYGDEALDNALKITLEMLKQFPISDVIAYPKLGKATLTMLETLLAKTNLELVNLDNAAYEHIMQICVEAFDHAEVAVSSSACTVINSVITNAIEGVEDGVARAEDLAKLVHGRIDINQYLLKALLNIVLFEDRSNDWSFSRPLFCLMVLQFDFAMQHTQQIVQYQPAERRDDLIAALKALFSATEFQLKSANRDAFTQALTQYRREVNTKNLILMVPTDQTLGAPVQILSGTNSGEDASAMAD